MLKKATISSLILTALILFIIGNRVEFVEDYANIVYDREGKIINASVSGDEQWRLFCDDELPEKLAIAILLFEDQYFQWHPGINPVSMVYAIKDNYDAGKIVRGGSTLTMQVARIAQGNKSRTYKQKIKEIIIALGLEMRYSKKQILQQYAQYAPFGGNIVGYCGASWKYFGKPATELSWSELAALAILPNAPGQIFPGQNQESFIRKRNFLLSKLHQKGHLDDVALSLALKEPLPEGILYFDQIVPHLHEHLKKSAKPNSYTSIDGALQNEIIDILKNYGRSWAQNSVYNSAALVIDNSNGEILSYVGNVDNSPNRANKDVDIIQSLRSPGSTMKPFLYGLCMDEGMITLESLIEDIPIFHKGFSPQNYDKTFRGMIVAKDALTQSLNIPAVNLLREYGIQPFIEHLQNIGFENTDKDDDHYGLSLILGGNEVTPMQLGQAYMNMARTVIGEEAIKPIYLKGQETATYNSFPLTTGTAWNLVNILTEVKRPRERDGWEFFTSKRDLAWKTGTSYGNRDAWAAGTSPAYTIIVWVGNASGEGRSGLTGLSKASPVLFAIHDLLPNQEWFEMPYDKTSVLEICTQSGFMSSPNCPNSSVIDVSDGITNITRCSFHKPYVMDVSGTYRVDSRCYDLKEAIDTTLFILSPRINHYLKIATGREYKPPELHPQCGVSERKLAILYPPQNAQVLLPRDIDEEQRTLICKATSSAPSDTLYWFLDDQFIKTTQKDHALEIDKIDPGQHHIAVTSLSGSSVRRGFEVVEE